MNIIETLMNLISAPMTPPKAYGVFHIVLMIVGLTVCISMAFILRKFDEKKNRILLLSLAGVLIFSEIIKQFFLYFITNDHAICWGEFPFQMCSLPMYLCLFICFSKNEKAKRAAYGFMMSFNLLGGLAGVFEPSGVFHDRVFLTTHAIIWHYMLVFLAFYIIFSGRGGKSMEDYLSTVKLFVVLCFIAFVINTLIGITVGDEVNMFFVGPNPTPIIVFNNIALKYGWAASTVIYIPITSLAAGIVFWINAKCRKR